ncbi:hypothetical protein H9P43_002155 [Blastocladiella emersonii ATCC 22665]|nr:hypothetical protein H9P43_002155 [Blastocladiella emersonii ATCC 22665]
MSAGGPPQYAIPADVRALIEDRTWLHEDAAVAPTYIVGVDYGTTFTGFGLHVVGRDPPGAPITIKCFDNWDCQPPGLFSAKLPTVSTYSRSDLSLEAWGWRAATDFSGRAHKVSLPKLALHPDTPAHRRPRLPEGLKVVDIIADYLAKLLGVIRTLAPDLRPDNTIWCFTIPVNWKADAMDVMRHAAFKAGMTAAPQTRQLRFCEEPEAAALTCIEESAVDMAPGSTFIVVDAGGGTVDLFQCTVGDDQHLDEITVGDGDFLGASFVDARFYDFLRTHIGDEAFEDLTLSPSLSNTWREVESRWENMKRTYRGPPSGGSSGADTHEAITFSLSLYKAIPEEYLSALRERQGTDDELWITPADMQSFFDPVVDSILAMVVRQLQAADRPVDHIFFVGGFGSNRYLQHRITSAPDVRARVRHAGTVAQIRQPESAVLKGAVRYGRDRARIRTRKAKHTLALLVHVNVAALAAVERDKNIVRLGNATYLVLVRKGDTVQYESLVTHPHLALGDHSTTGVVKIFEIDGPEPRLIGRITVSAPLTPGQKRRVTLLVNFGELELKIRAVHEITGQEWSASIQYDVTQETAASGSAPPVVKTHSTGSAPRRGTANAAVADAAAQQLTRSLDRLSMSGGTPASPYGSYAPPPASSFQNGMPPPSSGTATPASTGSASPRQLPAAASGPTGIIPPARSASAGAVAAAWSRAAAAAAAPPLAPPPGSPGTNARGGSGAGGYAIPPRNPAAVQLPLGTSPQQHPQAWPMGMGGMGIARAGSPRLVAQVPSYEYPSYASGSGGGGSNGRVSGYYGMQQQQPPPSQQHYGGGGQPQYHQRTVSTHATGNGGGGGPPTWYPAHHQSASATAAGYGQYHHHPGYSPPQGPPTTQQQQQHQAQYYQQQQQQQQGGGQGINIHVTLMKPRLGATNYSLGRALAIAAVSRAWFIGLAVAARFVASDFDASALALPPSSSFAPTALVRWDSYHFLGLATSQRWYAHEHHAAFFLLVPLLSRVLGRLIPTGDAWTAAAWGGVLANLAAFHLAVAALYLLVARVSRSPPRAFVAAVAFAVQPASVFMSAAGYTEAPKLKSLAAVLIVLAPMLAKELVHRSQFCTIDARPWCASPTSTAYAFVQARYWNVGWLRYWEPAQVPNFLLAAPMLVHSVLLISRHADLRSPLTRLRTPRPAGAGAGGWNAAYYVLHAAMVVLAVTSMHVQVCLRMFSVLPTVFDVSGLPPKWRRAWIAYSVVWASAGAVLFGLFYPPA